MINDIVNINKVKTYAKQRGIDIYDLHPEEYEIVRDAFKENTQSFFMDNIKKFQKDPGRNKICHGELTNYGTQKHALKAILVIDIIFQLGIQMFSKA